MVVVQRDDMKVVLICLASTVGALGFGFALGYSSPALPAMLGDVFHKVKCSHNDQSSATGSAWSSLINVGAMFGAYRSGHWLQSLGRRGALLYISSPFAVAGWLWTCLAQTVPELLIARLLIGAGVGVASSAVPVYIAESAPPKLRGALGALNQLAVTFGILLVYLIGLLLSHERHEYNCGDHAQTISSSGWRFLAFVGALIGLALFFVCLLLPETPLYLTSKQEAIAVQEDSIFALVSLIFQPASDLACSRAVRLSFMLMIFQQFSGINAIIFYASDILGTAGVSNRDLGGVIVMATQFFMTFVSCLCMDMSGRKKLLSISLITMTCANTLMALYFAFHLPPILAICALVIYISGFSIGLGPIPWLLMPEIIPTRARSRASSLATLLNWVCSFIITESFSTLLLPYLKPAGTFLLFALVTSYAFFHIQAALPETKALSFDAIESLFASTSLNTELLHHDDDEYEQQQEDTQPLYHNDEHEHIQQQYPSSSLV